MPANRPRRLAQLDLGLFPRHLFAPSRAGQGRWARPMPLPLKPLAAMLVLALGSVPWAPAQATQWVFSPAVGESVGSISVGFIRGGDSVRMNGLGRLVMTDNYTYTGGTFIDSGEVSLGQGGTVGDIVGNVVNNGVLTFWKSNDTSFAGTISGSGALVVRSLSSLTLAGNNTYSGGTTLFSGTLALASAGAIGSSGAITFNEAVLQYSSANQRDYSARISQSAGSVYRVDTNAQSVQWATGLASGSVTKSGAGALILRGVNSYAGATVIDGGELVFSNNGNQTLTGAVSGTGQLTKIGSGKLTLSGPPRQNSCRLHRSTPGAAMKDRLGSIRTGIQG